MSHAYEFPASDNCSPLNVRYSLLEAINTQDHHKARVALDRIDSRLCLNCYTTFMSTALATKNTTIAICILNRIQRHNKDLYNSFQ